MAQLYRILAFVIFSLFFETLWGGVDPLPSWNTGEAKSKILRFIEEITDKNSPDYIDIKERVAVFDQDGTLIVEKPFYMAMYFAADQIRSMSHKHSEWGKNDALQSLLQDTEATLNRLTIADIEEMVTMTHAGMSVDAFRKSVSDWLKTSSHPRFKRSFTHLIYQPMLEVINFFASHGFKNYIVSGTGQEFIRVYGEKVYGIPPEQTIGSAGKVRYVHENGNPNLLKLPEIFFIDDKQIKVENIHLFIGRRPLAAFGNSTGDQQMLEWTTANSKKHLELLIHHDDDVREYAYGPESKIGTFSEALKQEAENLGWIIVSMKNDWNNIFPNP